MIGLVRCVVFQIIFQIRCSITVSLSRCVHCILLMGLHYDFYLSSNIVPIPGTLPVILGCNRLSAFDPYPL